MCLLGQKISPSFKEQKKMDVSRISTILILFLGGQPYGKTFSLGWKFQAQSLTRVPKMGDEP